MNNKFYSPDLDSSNYIISVIRVIGWETTRNGKSYWIFTYTNDFDWGFGNTMAIEIGVYNIKFIKFEFSE